MTSDQNGWSAFKSLVATSILKFNTLLVMSYSIIFYFCQLKILPRVLHRLFCPRLRLLKPVFTLGSTTEVIFISIWLGNKNICIGRFSDFSELLHFGKKKNNTRVLTQVMLFFFTPIPCTYTSLPLDGMARNYYLFIFLHGYAKACNSSCLDPFNSYLLIPEERRKTFGLSWNRTQVLLLCKRPLWPLAGHAVT